MIHKAGHKERILPNPHCRKIQIENCIPDILWTLRIFGDVVQIHKCISHLSKNDQQDLVELTDELTEKKETRINCGAT